MDAPNNRNQEEEAQAFFTSYKKSIEVLKCLPSGQSLVSIDWDEYWNKRKTLTAQQESDQKLHPMKFFQSQVALNAYGKEHCQSEYKREYYKENVKKRYEEACKQVMSEDSYNNIRLDCTKHRYFEFIEADENVRSICGRHNLIAKKQLRSEPLKIGIYLLISGFGIVMLLNSIVDPISIASALAALPAFYKYHTTYYKTSTWDNRFGGWAEPMNYLSDYWQSLNPHGQILSIIRSRQRERVASALNFYGLGSHNDMTIKDNLGIMIANRDNTDMCARLARLKAALSEANEGKPIRGCVQKANNDTLNRNLKAEGSELLKYMELIIEREEMYKNLVKTKESEMFKKLLGETVVHPSEVAKNIFK